MPTNIHCRFLILGAGPTGLGAARQFEINGVTDWLLAEQSKHPGGLASSFTDPAGFTWDIGGHVQFSHYEYFDTAMRDFLGDDGWLKHQRESWVWMRDRFIPYPFQNNIHRLPPSDIEKCLNGLIDITRNPPAAAQNFQDWINAAFGAGIAELFLNPYNFKVWAHQPRELNSGWVGERVAVTDLKKVLSNLIHQKDDLSWGPNNTFQFPKKGGTGAIWASASKKLSESKQLFGQSVTSLDLSRRIAQTDLGFAIHYDALVSTIPLTKLLELAKVTQFDQIDQGLKSSSSNIFGVGLRGTPKSELASKCWMYFPEDDCPFYRVTVFSNYSPNNVPDISRYWSLMAEVSESPQKPLNSPTLFDEVVRGLINTKLIDDAQSIVSKWFYRAEYGYPIPSLRRDEMLQIVIPWLEARKVYSRGRFGLWKYEVSNQDHSFMQGVEIVERLINGRVEQTACDANYINARKHAWPFDRWVESNRG
jgi:protoporphyrinogen oxidase